MVCILVYQLMILKNQCFLYADHIVHLAENEPDLQCMIDKLRINVGQIRVKD